jgi:hypothetical protein
MAQQNPIAQPEAATVKEKKCSEPLFGPSIGPVSSGPAWTLSSEKKVLTDELTPDIVSSWIEKSKEVSSFLKEASQNKMVYHVSPRSSPCLCYQVGWKRGSIISSVPPFRFTRRNLSSRSASI